MGLFDRFKTKLVDDGILPLDGAELTIPYDGFESRAAAYKRFFLKDSNGSRSLEDKIKHLTFGPTNFYLGYLYDSKYPSSKLEIRYIIALAQNVRYLLKRLCLQSDLQEFSRPYLLFDIKTLMKINARIARLLVFRCNLNACGASSEQVLCLGEALRIALLVMYPEDENAPEASTLPRHDHDPNDVVTLAFSVGSYIESALSADFLTENRSEKYFDCANALVALHDLITIEAQGMEKQRVEGLLDKNYAPKVS